MTALEKVQPQETKPNKHASTVFGAIVSALILFVVIVGVLMIVGPLVGNVFSTINSSLGSFNYPNSYSPQSYTDSYNPQSGNVPEGGADAAPIAEVSPQAPQEISAVSAPAGRMIIKNADVKLQVKDTDVAIDRAMQIVGDAGGYIVSSRVWYQPHEDGKKYKYAAITLGVPVAEFERAMTKLRGLALQVLDETASGEDVSKQFVDLQSQVTNLEATRDRIKSFLEQAKTVDEALRINQELANIEAQIEQIKGQMNYLQDRSAYSTITVSFEPKLPELMTPTATATAAPTATPTPIAWNPGETFESAVDAVTYAYQGVINLLIWFVVVIIPIFAPPALLFWLLWKQFGRKVK